jgi:hypothetical protein
VNFQAGMQQPGILQPAEPDSLAKLQQNIDAEIKDRSETP